MLTVAKDASDPVKAKTPIIHLHQGDLPEKVDFGDSVAVDTETLGLNPHRDRLCVVQLSAGDGVCHVVHFQQPRYDAPNLRAVMADRKVTKIFHYARFDVLMLRRHLDVVCQPIYCTKIASKLVRTYTDRHGLKDLCRELLGLDLSKEQQSSDWGAEVLTPEQVKYAASDVLHLHALRAKLDPVLARESRAEIAKACFAFIPTRSELDILGWGEDDIFAH
ncbi:MAG: ribonuclease D [Rhodospirillales bacterium]|nr:ribonuclease D [Rhodospirillales bacterium]